MTVVTFKTKTEVFAFLEEFRASGRKAKIVTTPKEVKIGCGFAVEINSANTSSAYFLIKNGYFPTFNGIFTVKRGNGKSSITKII